jgi:hypothetical protein
VILRAASLRALVLPVPGLAPASRCVPPQRIAPVPPITPEGPRQRGAALDLAPALAPLAKKPAQQLCRLGLADA